MVVEIGAGSCPVVPALRAGEGATPGPAGAAGAGAGAGAGRLTEAAAGTKGVFERNIPKS